MFSVEDTSFSLGLDAYDEEFRCINCRNSVLKPGAKHSLLNKLNLVTMSDLTPRKEKLYDRNFIERLPCIFIRLRITTSNKCTSICLLDIQTLLHVSALLGHLQGVIHYRI
jgi:hypothetical protein